jgi:hypothetical protein
MHGFVLQDWLTIRGGSSITVVTQTEHAWVDLPGYQDVVVWLQVSEVTTGAGTITINYDTAPIPDESLFVAMGSTTISGTIMNPPTLTSVILSALPNQPLARLVRWRMTQSGASSAWDVTFRVLLAANPVGKQS